MLVHDYSSALLDLLLNGSKQADVFDSLKTLLKNKGHEKLYARILRDTQKRIEKQSEQAHIHVIVSREKDLKNLEDSILKTIATLGGGTEFLTGEDPTLIGGFKVIGYGKVIDQSFKKKLLSVYRSLTT